MYSIHCVTAYEPVKQTNISVWISRDFFLVKHFFHQL